MVKHAAVLGAGIMGASTALFLARRGVKVTVFDAADRPMARASRWNEGKIHLGYLYAGDPTLETARRVLPGGLAFRRMIESLIGEPIDGAVTTHDDTFLVHRDSVVPVESAAAYFARVAGLGASHPDAGGYLAPLDESRVRQLDRRELEARCDTEQIAGGFRVPERSVSTVWIADRIEAALRAEPRVELRLSTPVRGVQRCAAGAGARLRVRTREADDGPFDAVVNALWEGRLAIDAAAGVPPPATWSHRYRLSAFVRTTRSVDVPSAVVCTGPFGDVKNYNGREFYVSWYPSGLRAETGALAPEPPPALDDEAADRLVAEVLERITAVLPPARAVADSIDSYRLGGGWVYAAGAGSLADPASTLHRRDRFGVIRDGSYVSVDTGKYSIAPWLACRIVNELLA